jgi:hypothetical protein
MSAIGYSLLLAPLAIAGVIRSILCIFNDADGVADHFGGRLLPLLDL